MEELILTRGKRRGPAPPSKVQEHLDELKRFWRHEVLPLASSESDRLR